MALSSSEGFVTSVFAIKEAIFVFALSVDFGHLLIVLLDSVIRPKDEESRVLVQQQLVPYDLLELLDTKVIRDQVPMSGNEERKGTT